MFEHVVLALPHGSGYERIASPGCSDRTIRRRVKQWAELGIAQRVHASALEAYDRMIGLGLAEVSVDGCITKAPSGGEKAGRLLVDRGKQGLKRSVASDAAEAADAMLIARPTEKQPVVAHYDTNRTSGTIVTQAVSTVDTCFLGRP